MVLKKVTIKIPYPMRDR